MSWLMVQIGTLGAILMLVCVLVWLMAGAAREKRQRAREQAYTAAWEDWGDRTDLRRAS